jgi:hypothetical protein
VWDQELGRSERRVNVSDLDAFRDMTSAHQVRRHCQVDVRCRDMQIFRECVDSWKVDAC